MGKNMHGQGDSLLPVVNDISFGRSYVTLSSRTVSNLTSSISSWLTPYPQQPFLLPLLWLFSIMFSMFGNHHKVFFWTAVQIAYLYFKCHYGLPYLYKLLNRNVYCDLPITNHSHHVVSVDVPYVFWFSVPKTRLC